MLPTVLFFKFFYGDTTIDLSTSYPFLVLSTEHAIRLSHDPVAASDFFEFCIEMIFTHLFGWSYKKHDSTTEGGILGHLQAWVGTTELTERANFHGHFLIWVLGGLNPTEIHSKLAKHDDFERRFFAYFEAISWHHFPDVDYIHDPHFKPHTQRPSNIPSLTANENEKKEWDDNFIYEIKACGEILQRHTHRKVCYKYGNDGQCRFMFPHEVIQHSFFDEQTNSVFLMCCDSTVNFFNPYILVMCRHNHDIKCILSGKAAKAAMFYITDYITKMDIKTYEMLSLMSRAVISVSSTQMSSNIDHAKTLLHKCLSQFSRQQQVHGQQAVRYLRGLDDAMMSHKTIPMLSNLLLLHIRSVYSILYDTDESILNATDDENNDLHQSFLKVAVESNGRLINNNKVLDYWFRDDKLSHLNFYDFTRCVQLQKIKKPTADGIQLQHHFSLKHPHHLCDSHELVLHTDPNLNELAPNLLIPRLVGCSIPQATSEKLYAEFMIAHFKPFNPTIPLVAHSENFKECFDSYDFTEFSRKIMSNWEAIHECQDARDAERIKKQNQVLNKSTSLTSTHLL